MAKQGFLAGAYQERSPEEMREFYDRWSEIYDAELTENDYRQPRRCATALSEHLPDKSARILDVGCGTGLVGLALFENGFLHIDGCDLSTGMLEKAFETKIYSKLFIADLNKPPLDARDGEYDAVSAVGIFSIGLVMIDAIDEFMRVTKPGSPIVIGVNDPFYRDGRLTEKLSDLSSEGRIRLLFKEYGDHIPGAGISGWVIVFEKMRQGDGAGTDRRTD